MDLGSLSSQQLLQVKKQLDDELEHLNDSFNRLRGAQAKFGECMVSIQAGVRKQEEGEGLFMEQLVEDTTDFASQGQPILVPLTTSLYVPGMLASSEKVIVDVGTGFYVEKVLSFYKRSQRRF